MAKLFASETVQFVCHEALLDPRRHGPRRGDTGQSLPA